MQEEDPIKKRIRERKDPVISKIPERPPATAPGSNASNTSFFFTQYVMSQREKPMKLEDPREEMLRVDADARADPKYFGSAYASTQPVTKLHDITFEEEQEQFKKKQRHAL